ncbi:TrbC/VirB2 family protein [Hydrogenophaga sp. 5NK40-0174]|uniref:TrbC/VirB2 family protein n=1 Tax=Hydrogenophaga sp. 5NK40-0174 TaxID=3127649 RepID=UPI00310987D2
MNFGKLSKSSAFRVLSLALLASAAIAAAPETFAQTVEGFQGACENVEGFFKNFETMLRVASVSIVTIAIVFAGYQIAFAHKRLTEVAPILVGGLLIGGAATIAGWFVEEWTSADASCAFNDIHVPGMVIIRTA